MTLQDLNALWGAIDQQTDVSYWPRERSDFAAEVIGAVEDYVRSLPDPRSDELDYLSRAKKAANQDSPMSEAFPGIVEKVRAALPGTNPNDRSQFIWGVVARLRQREVQVGNKDAITSIKALEDVVGQILPA